MENELIKETIRVGNSAGVLLPKKWLNSQVKVVLQPLNIKKEILEILLEENLLAEVQGIYIVGSYARNEQTIDSDADILVITNTLKKLIKKGKYDITLIPKENVENQLKKNILPLLPMLIEARPLLNAELIKPYKNTKLTKRNLDFHIETTKSAMKVIEKSISLSKDMEIKESGASSYSLILRLRGIYIIDCLIKKKKWSKKELLELIKNISGSLIAYEGYLKVKADEKWGDDLPIKEAEKIHDYVVKKIKEQEKWLKERKGC
jgi:predicted nucleotidyltransferase